MMRKVGLAFIIFFSLLLVALITKGITVMPKWLFVTLTVLCCVLVPFGFALVSVQSKSSTPRRIHLGVGIFLVSFGLVSRYFSLPGAGIEIIVGILWFCFAYSPLELQHKYQKWLPYSKSKFESFLLSSIDFAGITMLAVGLMFKIQKWPGADSLQFFGLLILVVGLISWNVKFKKEVVRRKEAEDKIQEQLSEIQDSINYAKRIQSAILPPDRIIKEALPNSFILYLPKDIVAGDFYWLEKSADSILIAAADCTGHGVPGALVSVVCNNALNRAVREFGLTEPGKILDKTREIVISEFEKSADEVKDGMDISLVALNFNVENGVGASHEMPLQTASNYKLQWAGANNPLWIIRSKALLAGDSGAEPGETASGYELVGVSELVELKPDKQPIGKYAEQKPFTTHQIEMKQGDTIYIFTDGFQDQFGGEKGKKFKPSALKELLLSIHQEPMQRQKELLETKLLEWRGDIEQIDDVCIIGIRI